jgi:predicted ATPase
MVVLAARGVEAEAELPYAALSELLAPIAEHLPSLPPPQRRALSVALALEASAPIDPFAVYVGTLTLLGAAGERSPVVALLDDVQWFDAGSVEATTFAARRLGQEAVALVLAARARRIRLGARLRDRRAGA